MAKVQFSDVIPPEKKRSIRDVPIPSGKRKPPIIVSPNKNTENQKEAKTINKILINKEPDTKNYISDTENKTKQKTDTDMENSNNNIYQYYYLKDKEPNHHSIETKSNKKFIFGSLAVLAISGFIFGMMTIFSSATIEITPKSKLVSIGDSITLSNSIGTSTVKYEIIKLTKTNTVSVPATGEEAVETKASGKITIYNNFSSEPQKLMIRTRFETPEGLIFRIPESVVVPGKTIKNGTETPGSIEVEVFADEAGEKYNIKKSDFTIPGFKNDPSRYKGFYARSSTNMTGGFIGKMKTVSTEEKQSALITIEESTKLEIEKELKTKIPNELTMLQGSIIHKTKDLPQKEDGSSVLIGKEITAYAVMINKQDLSMALSEKYLDNLPDWQNINGVIKDFSNISISNIPTDIENVSKIDAEITGEVLMWADIDTELIKNKIIGVQKKEVAKLMDEFAGITSIKATIRPTWKRSLPKDISKIDVESIINK